MFIFAVKLRHLIWALRGLTCFLSQPQVVIGGTAVFGTFCWLHFSVLEATAWWRPKSNCCCVLMDKCLQPPSIPYAHIGQFEHKDNALLFSSYCRS